VQIQFNSGALRKTKWYEYAERFFFGGAITVAAGLLAKHYGPVFGGVFLAFPAIFPASATLLDKHEKQRKRRAGIPFTLRGRRAAALDARGAALGSIGLALFAFAVWKLLPLWNAALCLAVALILWIFASILLWRLLKLRHRSASYEGH
jgi:hypothetical protein